MNEVAIIGIGNPFRGDDGAGWAVIDLLKGKIDAKIPLFKIRGEIMELTEHFQNYSSIYLIDACKSDAPIGSWRRIDALQDHLLLEETQTSTHGLSVSQAVSLARALNQLPTKLIIYAISSDQYNMSSGLSKAVAQAVQAVAQSLLKEPYLCMKKA